MPGVIVPIRTFALLHDQVGQVTLFLLAFTGKATGCSAKCLSVKAPSTTAGTSNLTAVRHAKGTGKNCFSWSTFVATYRWHL